MKRYVLFLLLSVILVSVTKAQVSYNFSATTGTFSSIAATGTHPTLVSPDVAYTPTDEGYANAVPIGFNFAYNGANYTTVNINANGYLTLGGPFAADPGETYYYDSLAGGPVSLPSARPVIAPFWSDLDVQAASNMTYTITGTSPNRVFVVEWTSALWDYSATTASISFQAKLYETTNIIQFIYQQESGTPSGARAKIGLSASGVGTGNFLALSNATGTATVSSTVEGEIFSRPATGQIFIFAPMSCFPPSSLTLTNVTGTSATVSWSAVTGALGYEYAVGTTATPPTGAGTATPATTANLSGLSAGINYVYVRTKCSATTFSLWTVKAIIPCTTNLLPANGATGVAVPPTLSWSPVAGCDGYTVMFSTDGITYTPLGTIPPTSTSVSVPGTVANTTYWWYIRATLGSDTALKTCVANATSFTTFGTGGVPPNDNECNAIALTVNGPSDCQNTALATVEANETGVLSCSTPNNTVWYTYTPATSGTVTVIMKRNVGATTNLNGWVTFFTTGGTCPSLTLTQTGACSNADLTINDSVIITSTTLTAGIKYYIMIDGFSGAIGEFCIRLTGGLPPPVVPVNDSVCNAIALTLNGPSDCENTAAATIEANDPTVFSCSTPNNTVWYTYTPATTGTVDVVMKRKTGATTNLNAWVGFFTATGSCPALTLVEEFSGTCNNADLTLSDSVIITSGVLTAGTKYYLMIDGFSGAIGEFCIRLKDGAASVPGPINDTICKAIALTLNGATDCQNTELATIETAEPTFSCSTPNNTVWYTYTPTTTGPVKITVKKNPTALQDLDAWVSLFTTTGTCPSLTLTEFSTTCNEADLTANDSVIIVTDVLTAGTKYYIMIDGFAGAVGGFCIYLSDPPAAPLCATLLVPVDNATNVSAPATPLFWTTAIGADGYNVALGTVNPPTVLGSIADTTVTITGLAYNTTYYWSITPTNQGVPATGCTTVFTFTTGAAPPPPANDPCTGAINLPDGVPVPGTTISATQTLAADSCNGFIGDANDDVWYSITALNNGDATITLIPDGNFDAVLEAFSGTCGTLTSIACADDSVGGQMEIMTLTGLTAGQVVYIRAFDYGAAGTEGTFTIHAAGTALLPVKLTSFKGEKTGSKNILTWSTASEQNNRGFELQRSADGENFSSMVFVPSKGANGNSSTALSYQFADEKPFSGNSYYRLKQVDYDGKAIYSNIVLIKGTRSTSITMSAVYPNPVKETLKVVLAAPVSGSISLVVTDLAGKMLMQQSARLIAGDNSLSVSVKHLPSGSYLIKAVCANGCETTVSKFVKQ